MEEKIIAVDFDDNELYRISKEEAHKKPILHRAFSVFLYDGEYVLLQRRAKGKYHSGLLIANSCCSHPRTKTNILDEARSRVKEELGADIDLLTEINSFVYCNQFNENLFEYEYDYVLVGEVNKDTLELQINPEEVEGVFWLKIDEVKEQLILSPEKFAVWFKTAFDIFLKYKNKNK